MPSDPKLLNIVREFDQLLRALPDDPEYAHQVTKFLQKVLRSPDIIPPTTEIMTVLKHEKPRIYYHLRYRTTRSSHFYILYQLQTSYESAKQKLDDIMHGGAQKG